MITGKPYIKSVYFKEEYTKERPGYPYQIPAVRDCDQIQFHPDVTFFIGENGSGKSTLLEAIAVAYGFNPEGGTKSALFEVHNTHSDLHREIRLSKSFKTPGDAFFLRAESFYNVATMAEKFDVLKSYGGKSLHAQSHGEAFLSTLMNKLTGNGLYLLDEPEAALSPARQLAAIRLIHQLVGNDSQFIIATHSPIIMAYPNATIYEFNETGIKQVLYEETDHYQITRSFLENPALSLQLLMENEEE
jgi:predicted ATPase